MYSKELMSGVFWGFFGGKYYSYEKFNEAVSDYNKDFDKTWNPNETVLDSSNVSVLYSYWDYDKEDEIEEIFDLVADNKSSFTTGELLFKAHNQVVDKLENETHNFFEGFLLGNREHYNNPNEPFYFIHQAQ